MLQRSPELEHSSSVESPAADNEPGHKFDRLNLSHIKPGDRAILIIDGLPFRLVKQESVENNKGRGEENWSIFRNGQSMGETAFTLMLIEEGCRSTNAVVVAGRTAIMYADPNEDPSERKFRKLGSEKKPGSDSMSASGIPSDIYILAAAKEEEQKAA